MVKRNSIIKIFILFSIIIQITSNCYAQIWQRIAWPGVTSPVKAFAKDAANNIYASVNILSPNTPGVSVKTGNTWTTLGGATSFASLLSNLSGEVLAIYVDQFNNVYAGGSFKSFNGKTMVVKWDGSTWSILQGNYIINGNGDILSITGDANGNIYVGGKFYTSQNQYCVVKFNGSDWSTLPGFFNGYINSLCVDNIGNLYAAGKANCGVSWCVYKFDGTNWSIPGGLYSLSANNEIYSLTYSNGNLYAAGSFTNALGNRYVAKWDGTNWSELGSGTGFAFNSNINSICSDNLGQVYAGGDFSINGYKEIVQFDGSSWKLVADVDSLH